MAATLIAIEADCHLETSPCIGILKIEQTLELFLLQHDEDIKSETKLKD